MLLRQFIYLGMLILIGVSVLSLRRKADGSRIGYKLVLLLLGMLLGVSTFGNDPLFVFDEYFLKTLSVFLMVVLLFELCVRLNRDSIEITYEGVGMFCTILALNILVLGLLSTFMLNINFMHGVILSIVLSSIEYFLVDQLKSEGDLANPLVLLFAFSIMVFYSLEGRIFENIIYFLKYILIGLGMGVFVGILVFKCMKNREITPAIELGLVASTVATYMLTEQLSGSGLFSVMVLGVFFGNSYVRRTAHMHSFSPFIFKTLEMLIFLMIGFVVTLRLGDGLWWKALVIFAAYVSLRLLVMHLFYRHYSIGNKLLLSFAPKGMILGSAILVLGVFGSVEDTLLSVMVLILFYSLISGVFVERIEQQKSLKLDKAFQRLMRLRFGRNHPIRSHHRAKKD